MHGPATAPAAPADTTCNACGADGPVRIVDAGGSARLCVLHAMVLVAEAEQGRPVALVLDAAVSR